MEAGSAAELLPFDAPRDFTCSRCPERGTYLMEMDCSNCGLFFTARFTLGHEADASRCPQCECKTAKPVTLSGRRRGSVG